MKERPVLSVIVPCYNEQEVLPRLYGELCRVAGEMTELTFEMCFVDDGSADGTAALLRARAREDVRVRYCSFSRNFGKEAAILAGLRMATGDYVVLMDADLQHPPSMLPEMYAALRDEGYDCCAARRVAREGEPKTRGLGSRLFFGLMRRLSDTELVPGATDYRLMRRCVVEAVLSLPESNRFTKGIFAWVGFRTKWLPYVSAERAAGETKWSLGKLLRYSADGLVAFSVKPLTAAAVLGVIACAVALAVMAVVVVRTLLFGNDVAGYPTLISVMLLLGGIQMLFIGILGQYLAKTYAETKRRPAYIVRETEKERE